MEAQPQPSAKQANKETKVQEKGQELRTSLKLDQ